MKGEFIMTTYKFDTLQVHAGQSPDPATGSRAIPIYQTSSYVFNNAQHAEDLFSLQESGNIYSRIMNPTNGVLEERVAALEGGAAALSLSSGAAAVTYSVLNITKAGDEIVAASTLYGGTYNLFANTLPQYGIKVNFVHPDNFTDLEEKITEKTKAVYIESIGNPSANLVDIEKIANLAHKNNIPLIVDNTFATPYLCRPIEFGADIVVHSLTKFIGGHGTTIGGIIVDSGKFNWKGNEKFPQFNEPDPNYHGIIYSDALGAVAYIGKARVTLLRDMGAALSPFNGFLFLQGLETLSLRMEKHISNTEKIADFLVNHSKVIKVNYPGLRDNFYYKLKEKYFPKGCGSIFTFEIKGGKKESQAFIDELELFSLLANVGDAKSLVIHPASTTHQQLSEEIQKEMGIYENTIRLSIGIEDSDDLIQDLEKGFDAI